MQVGVQRRSIYLVPVQADEVEWLTALFDHDEIWRNFGYSGPSRSRISAWLQRGHAVVSVIRRVGDRERLGFALAFPPHDAVRVWELAYAIPAPQHRNAFHAINAVDALLFYMFEVMQVDEVSWRTRQDNVAGAAVLARIGYRPAGLRHMHGVDYVWHVVDQELWQGRKAKLERNEQKYPSSAAAAFAILKGPGFEPVRSAAERRPT